MNNPLISPSLGTFIWMLVSFGILVFILAKFGWPLILKSLKERETAITESLAAADKAKQEMKQLQTNNEELLKQCRLERDEMLRIARQTSEKIIEDARTKATEESNRIVEMAQERIENEKKKAMHELKNQIATLSIEMAEILIQDELKDKDRANEVIRRQLEETNLN